ncbi:MAG TPA: dicarboxylate/amino acid:cation symporter [Gemmataceae bacterium]|jgi:DAACS family dicarboxylate/amino acid:cation (Na+ or H+) symporter|nr:dicarboxylate/amino acid:cation symporter [Gemmataceae bacterium]
MTDRVTPVQQPTGQRPRLLAWYQRTPLYLRILIALVLGMGFGWVLGERAIIFKPFSDIVLRLLGALATPLIFVAVVHALLRAKVSGRTGGRLAWFLLTNTVVAILIGLLVANAVRPGRWVRLEIPQQQGPEAAAAKQPDKPFDPVEDLLGKIPGSLFKPLADNDIMSVIIIALAFGVALRVVRRQQEGSERPGYRTVEDLLDTAFRCVMVLLHWIFHLVPLAVFGVVARLVGTQGLGGFVPLGGFIVAVLLALLLQAVYYLARLRLGSWVRPGRFLRGGSDALVTAFSTASSAATLPVTYACMMDKVGVREESASLGVMVGGTFNHDGTALYEAMAALFISQVLGRPLDLGQQLLVVVMSVFASVGAAGIPEAGLVTMLAVFTAVRLPAEYIPLLLTVDWFLDRCRTAINVMGDMCVTCLLDGRKRADTVVVPVPSQPQVVAVGVGEGSE